MGYIALSFFFLSGILAILTAATFFATYRRQKEIRNLFLFAFFLSMGILGISTGGPALIAVDSDFRLDAYRLGHVISTACAYFMLFFGIYALKSLSRDGYARLFNLAILITTVIGSSVVTALYMSNVEPKFLDSGIVVWNQSSFISTITGFYVIAFSLIWTYIFFNAASLIFATLNRLRTLTLSAAGLFLGGSIFLLYIGKSQELILTGMMLFITASIVTFIVYVLPATHSATRGLDHI